MNLAPLVSVPHFPTHRAVISTILLQFSQCSENVVLKLRSFDVRKERWIGVYGRHKKLLLELKERIR